MACDWLKECGYHNYGKPDRHIVDILYGTRVAPNEDNYTIFKTLARIARVNDELPAVIDRLLWYIGSGRYVDQGVKITRGKTQFIELLRPKLGSK